MLRVIRHSRRNLTRLKSNFIKKGIDEFPHHFCVKYYGCEVDVLRISRKYNIIVEAGAILLVGFLVESLVAYNDNNHYKKLTINCKVPFNVVKDHTKL